MVTYLTLIIYNILFFLGFAFYLPWFLLSGKFYPGFWQRMGFLSKDWQESFQGRKNIWIHAVSVGEVRVVFKLIEELQGRYPEHRIVLSTVTQTGYRLASSRFNKQVRVIYAPLDFVKIVGAYIRLIRPQIYISVETEIWPNLFYFLQKQQVPIVLVNGRISDSSLRGYKRLRFFLKSILRGVDAFCMQTQDDADKLMALGAAAEKIQIVDNMKFDDTPEPKPIDQRDSCFDDKQLLWVAGSTHPGEEEIILKTYQKLVKEFSSLRLLIAPRHIERTAQVEQLVKQEGLKPLRFSESQQKFLDEQSIVILDTIGHLRSLYSLATLVFVGKSLVGHGGQNIMEPAFFGKPVIVGPHMQNFQTVYQFFQRNSAVIEVKTEEELYKQIKRLLQEPEEAVQLGERAQKVIEEHQGATQRTLEIIANIMARR